MIFDRFARAVSRAAGSGWAFSAALAGCVIWAGSGPLFGFSDTWQLIANTATTIVTFLMVFLIQHSQNEDTKEMKAELRELVEDLPDVNERRARERASEGNDS